jgi:hypothetical protein
MNKKLARRIYIVYTLKVNFEENCYESTNYDSKMGK